MQTHTHTHTYRQTYTHTLSYKHKAYTHTNTHTHTDKNIHTRTHLLTQAYPCETSVMLELWGMQSTLSLPSLPGPLWPGVVAPDRVLSMGQIELNCELMLN